VTRPGTVKPDVLDYGRPVRPNDKWRIGAVRDAQTIGGPMSWLWYVQPVDPHAHAIWARNPRYRRHRVYLRDWNACLRWVIAAQTTDP
jgi:hypothetical protein